MGLQKDREGENFIYMHRHMLARYDANRWCLGMPLSIDGRPDGVRVPFPARPPNQVFRDIVTMGDDNTETVFAVKDLTNILDEIEYGLTPYQVFLSALVPGTRDPLFLEMASSY
ncbi:unnamed protein product [Rhizophagus irregularis]|nr:unnamed protein product [Rhizophagus irregularis]